MFSWIGLMSIMKLWDELRNERQEILDPVFKPVFEFDNCEIGEFERWANGDSQVSRFAKLH